MPETPHIVSDVMTLTVVAVGRDAPFKEIVETMGQWRVSAMPVLEGEGRVIGVVSEADLLPKEEFRNSDPSLYEQRRRLSDVAKAGAVTAAELMSTPAITVHPDVTLAQAARIMAVRHVKRLPVVGAGQGRRRHGRGADVGSCRVRASGVDRGRGGSPHGGTERQATAGGGRGGPAAGHRQSR
ncbi:hypothetical protein GCM10010306_025650 [Streptomyces umbrinus]|nr:hypothetical protein GCM10010306_025650 [Streptomyces umbrinus]